MAAKDPTDKALRQLVRMVKKGDLHRVVDTVTSWNGQLQLLTTWRRGLAGDRTPAEVAVDLGSRVVVNGLTYLCSSCRGTGDPLSSRAKSSVDLREREAMWNYEDPVVVASRLHEPEMLHAILSEPVKRFRGVSWVRELYKMVTPLSACLESPRGFLEVAEILVCSGIGKGAMRDALDTAASTCHKDPGPLDFLLAHGVDLNEPSFSGGRTIVAVMAARQTPGAVRALLRAGADPRIVDAQGNTALHEALHKGGLRTVRTIIRYFPDLDASGVTSPPDTDTDTQKIR